MPSSSLSKCTHPAYPPTPAAVFAGWRNTADWLLANPFRQYLIRPAMGNEAGRGEFQRAIVAVNRDWSDPPAFEQLVIASSYAEAEHYADDRGETISRKLFKAVQGNENPHLLRRERIIFTRSTMRIRVLRPVHGLPPPAAFVVQHWAVDPDNEDRELWFWQNEAFRQLPESEKQAWRAASATGPWRPA